MLSAGLRKKLIDEMRKNPKNAIKEIEKDPKILDILLNSDNQVEAERNERIKYINMNYQMQNQLQQQAKKLNTTQGLLLGAGLLLLLKLLDDRDDD